MRLILTMVLTMAVLVGCGRFGFSERRQGPDPDARDPDAGVCSAYVPWGSLPSRYRLGGNALDWAVAEADCESDGGHLVVVNDVTERDELRAQIATNEIWIGLSDRITEGTYLEVTGAAPSYSEWPGAVPSNVGEDCVEILLNANYEDTACVQLLPIGYACECDGTPARPGAF